MPSSENKLFAITHRDKVGGLVLDSGTWSLNNRKSTDGARITFEGYVQYCRRFGHLFDMIFNFDEDFTPEGFETNLGYLIRMEQAGLRPVPVIHDVYGEEVDYYIERDYRYVALGSRQITSMQTLRPVVMKLHRAGVKVHLFGTVKFDFIANLPVSSCDTTSWARDGGFGFIHYWNPATGDLNKGDKIYLGDYVYPDKNPRRTFLNYPHREELEQYLDETFGFSYEDLMGRDAYLNRKLVNTHYLVQLEEEVTRIHRARGYAME